jgi:hypothetical protein
LRAFTTTSGGGSSLSGCDLQVVFENAGCPAGMAITASPLFDAQGKELRFFLVAAVVHHQQYQL